MRRKFIQTRLTLHFTRKKLPLGRKGSCSEVIQKAAPSSRCACWVSPVRLCVTPMDCSPPGSSVHGILQARILEWVAMPSSKGSPPPRDQTRVSCVSCIGRRFLPLPLGSLWHPQDQIKARAFFFFQWYRWTYLQGRKRDADVGNGPVDVGGGGMNWEIRSDICALACVK